MEKTNIFKCKPPEVHFTIRDRVPYNKLLTNLASSSRTVEYWPSVVFVRTSLRSVRTATTSGQYSPVWFSRSVSKRLIFLSSALPLLLLLPVAFCTPNHKHECDLNIEGGEGPNVIFLYNICDRDCLTFIRNKSCDNDNTQIVVCTQLAQN